MFFIWLLLLLTTVGLLHGWQVSLEKAVEEFKVATQEMGLREGGPTAKAARPSVFGRWHGRVFENFRNDKLDATPHEVVQRGGSRNLLRRNQFGINAGGPVIIPGLYDGSRRTFVNVSHEGVRCLLYTSDAADE